MLILAIGGWMMLNRKSAEPSAKTGGTALTAPSPQLQDLLQRAQQAGTAGNLIAADGEDLSGRRTRRHAEGL